MNLYDPFLKDINEQIEKTKTKSWPLKQYYYDFHPSCTDIVVSFSFIENNCNVTLNEEKDIKLNASFRLFSLYLANEAKCR